MEPKRRWCRSHSDGQLGYVVEKEDSNGVVRQMFRLDRPQEELLRPYNENNFTDEADRPITKMQRARIAYESDRALRMALGEAQLGIPEWVALKDEQRIKFRDNGPNGDQRAALYDVIMAHFSDAI